MIILQCLLMLLLQFDVFLSELVELCVVKGDGFDEGLNWANVLLVFII